MKKVMIIAAALLVASSAGAFAQRRGNVGGASEFAPGDQMKDRRGSEPNSRGASEYAPEDQKKDAGSTAGRDASEFSPGDRSKDSTTVGNVQKR
jgi:hypothetical protein